ncbi:hypothetical protein UQW22_09460 [Isoptericola halotolerans]|uniref:hypothetical protein n=1 Tax=Isoptericola halotolerans TaxID=300560 RepID=UPI00388D6012
MDVDQEAAEAAALLHVPVSRPAHDALIAAAAVVHRLVVATRNGKDFAPWGIVIENPWEPKG